MRAAARISFHASGGVEQVHQPRRPFVVQLDREAGAVRVVRRFLGHEGRRTRCTQLPVLNSWTPDLVTHSDWSSPGSGPARWRVTEERVARMQPQDRQHLPIGEQRRAAQCRRREIGAERAEPRDLRGPERARAVRPGRRRPGRRATRGSTRGRARTRHRRRHRSRARSSARSRTSRRRSARAGARSRWSSDISENGSFRKRAIAPAATRSNAGVVVWRSR